jgi:DNA polymerase I-like protein with 3'-5' exonuclease and polymerase domains
MYCAMLRFRELWNNLNEAAAAGSGGAFLSVPILQIHDSLVVDVHPQETDVVARLLHQAMHEAPILAAQYGVVFDVPIECEIKAGPNWGETETLEVTNG